MRGRLKLKKQFRQNPRKYSKKNPVPPTTLIAVREDNPGPYSRLLNQTLRVGYYSKQDGLNVIWIVYPDGKYGESTDHACLNRFFRVISVPEETDFHGDNRTILQAIEC
jgi:hypothetical protein